MDYVRLRFNGPTLTVLTPPAVETAGRVYSWGGQGFRDALCERIAKTVTLVLVRPAAFLRIEFDDGARIMISLRDEDRQTGEAVIFDDGPSNYWIL